MSIDSAYLQGENMLRHNKMLKIEFYILQSTILETTEPRRWPAPAILAANAIYPGTKNAGLQLAPTRSVIMCYFVFKRNGRSPLSLSARLKNKLKMVEHVSKRQLLCLRRVYFLPVAERNGAFIIFSIIFTAIFFSFR